MAELSVMVLPSGVTRTGDLPVAEMDWREGGARWVLGLRV